MAGYEEVTPAQLDYIIGLANRVRTERELKEKGNLNRNQASEVISALKMALGEETNVVPITRAQGQSALLGRGTEEGFVFETEDERPPEKPPWQIEQEEYNRRQWQVFISLERVKRGELGSHFAQRDPMEYNGRPIVYQRWPHTRRVGAYHDRETGWAWVCMHPQHQRPVHGGSSYGWYTTLLYAELHSIKCREKEAKQCG
jgi:hypothetical protein